jgi:SpoVK/Ycf46/Vps4 family AAA+-type ATPase
MPRTHDLARLFSAVAHGDLPRARVLAGEIADAEERAGKPGAAGSLRKALVTHSGAITERAAPLPVMSLAAPDVLTQVPACRLSDVELTPDVRSKLSEVIQEHRHRDLLRQHDLEPQNRLFFHGPPGCGKTAAARALAGELGLPAYVVRFDALLGAYLGQTSARMHEIFRFASSHPCVVLFDEIDAVGRRRGASTDVGELDRVVISLMQQLDLVRPLGVLVAASNIPQDLDPALLRRFDLLAEFPLPQPADLARYAQQTARRRGVELVNGVAHALASATTYAEAEKIIVAEQRRVIVRAG